MLTAREEIQKLLDEWAPPYVGVNYLRQVESELEDITRVHGPHPLVSAAIRKISARIVFLEIGKDYK
jgi:hypothetical protein